MNCPLCLHTVLDVTYHAGIELDICPNCRGVWLDRGELNRIVDETGSRSRAASPARRSDRPTHPEQRDRGSQVDHRDDRSPGGRTRRKRTFASRLGDVFEEIVDL
jgi:Zn-finger nucleic acid-binding protein